MFCIFSELVNNQFPRSVIYEDNLYLAVLDIQPVNPGHVLLILKRHSVLLSELNDHEYTNTFPLAIKISNVQRKMESLEVRAINLLLADGKETGKEIFHFHLHIISRHEEAGFGFKYGKTYYALPKKERIRWNCKYNFKRN